MASRAASGPFAHVVLEVLVREPLVRIDPGDHEHREALIDAPFDEGFFRREIEHVELVDPGRHDQQRRLQHRRRRRRVLDELHQLVLEDHLAGRDREIAADLEFRGVGLADLQIAAAGLDVLGQHVHAAHEVLGVGAERLAQQLRIGQHEVRRRQRVGDLLDVELGLLAGVRVEALGVLDQMVGPVGGEQIGLLEEVEELVRRPFRIGEAPVLRIGRDDRAGRFAGQALGRRAPQIEIGPAEPRLQFDRAARIGQPVAADLAERLDHVGHLVGEPGLHLAFLARLHVGGERLAAFLDHAGEVLGKRLDVDGADLHRCWRNIVLHGHPAAPGLAAAEAR